MAVTKFKMDGIVIQKDYRPAREKEVIVQGKVYPPRPDEFSIAVLIGVRDETKKFFFETVPEVLTCQVAFEDFIALDDVTSVNMEVENNSGKNRILAIEGMRVISKEDEKSERLSQLMKAKGLESIKSNKKGVKE